jgi:hypothetical protein
MRPLALSDAPRLEPPSRLRLAGAVLVLGAALAGAATLHSYRFVAIDCGFVGVCSRPDLIGVKPGWVGPTTLALCLFGVAAAVGLLTVKLRVATAMVVLGTALIVAAVVYHDPGAQLIREGCRGDTPASCTPHLVYNFGRAGWVAPTALGISLLGVALTAGILLRALRKHPE